MPTAADAAHHHADAGWPALVRLAGRHARGLLVHVALEAAHAGRQLNTDAPCGLRDPTTALRSLDAYPMLMP